MSFIEIVAVTNSKVLGDIFLFIITTDRLTF